MNRKRNMAALAAGLLAVSLLTVPARAVEQSELDAAVSYVREQGIMVGDQNGNMDLDAGLNRAELAVLLTRLKGVKTEDLLRSTSYYSMYCGFADVPEWARPFVGCCAQHDLLAGYDSRHYGAADPVTPAAACTVVLRVRDIGDGGGSNWGYSTAASYAASLGWIDQSTTDAATVTRGDMAVLLYRALTGTRSTAGVSTSSLANGKPVTEQNVLELLHQIETDWPTGTVWGKHTTPGTHWNEVPSTAANRVMDHYWVSREYGCSGYASMVSSLVFGDTANPARRVEDLSKIRPGDMIFRVSNEDGSIWHVTVALESPNSMDSFHFTAGNHGGTVWWPEADRPYSREVMACFGYESKAYHLEAWTRYPADVPYSGESENAWGVPAPGSTP